MTLIAETCRAGRFLSSPAPGRLRRRRHRIHARQDLLAAALPGPDRRARRKPRPSIRWRQASISTPLFELMADPKVTKVFHAARQDVEIFFHLTGKIPAPLVDTQVAAMVCGFGDSVSYETLAGQARRCAHRQEFAFHRLGATSADRAPAALCALRRHSPAGPPTNISSAAWPRRDASAWVAEEMAVLTNPATYRLEPAEAWRRIKFRTDKPRAHRHAARDRRLARGGGPES